jgi:hypothetical protein
VANPFGTQQTNRFLHRHWLHRLAWLIPVEESTLHLPLSREIVHLKFSGLVAPGLVVKSSAIWPVFYRYTVYFDGESVKIKGPYGNRKWCLLTTVEMQPELSGVALRLRMRLSTGHIFLLILIFGGYLTGVLLMMPVHVFVFPLIFQILFMYTVMLLIFRYEAQKIRELLKRTLMPEA